MTMTLRGAPRGAAAGTRRWAALAVLLAAAAMNLIDLTIVTVGMPSIRTELRAGPSTVEWIVAGYSLAFGVGLVTGGRLGDVYGRRNMLSFGIAGFVLSSAVCGAAPSGTTLVLARVAQGASAALMVPQVLATIQVLFEGGERDKALGLWGAMLGLATVGSPILGALLLESDVAGLGWRSIFLVNIPIGVATLVGSALLVPESRSSRPLRLDPLGTLLLTATLLLVLFPLVRGQAVGWPPWTFVAMAASIPSAALFVAYERRLGEQRGALVPLRLFRSRGFSSGVLFGLVFFSGIVGFSLVLQLTLQEGLGFSPMRGALAVLPFSIGIVEAAPVAMRLVERHGRRLPLVGTLLIVAGALAIEIAVHRSGPDLTWVTLAPGLLLCGLAVGTVSPTLTRVALSEVDAGDAGAASGIISSANQIGAAIGAAGIGAIYFHLLGGQLRSPEAGQAFLGGGDPRTLFLNTLDGVLPYAIAVFALSAALVPLLPAGRYPTSHT